MIIEWNITLEYENGWITFKTKDRSFVSDFNNVIPHDTQSRWDRTPEQLQEIFIEANKREIKPDNRIHNLKWYLYSFI